MTTDELIRRLAAEGAAPRVAPIPRRLALALGPALAALALGVGGALGVRPDLPGYALTEPGLLKFLGAAGAAAAGIALAAALARPDPARRGWAPALGLLAAVLAGAAALVATAETTAPLAAAARGALDCVWPVPLLAAPPLAAGLLALRAGAPRRPALAGAAAGLAAGALAAIAYALWCPADDPVLVAIGYGAALALTTAAGALIGARALAW